MIDIFLNPGDHFVGDARHRVHTLLGSCVSITLWHAERRIGAMSHFVLTDAPQCSAGPLDGRYGEEALALMVRQLIGRGVDPGECRAKLFGGGDMFPEQSRPMELGVGHRNGTGARALLQSRGIGVTSESLFGNGHRRICFDISTGDVWVRQSEPTSTHGGLA